MIKRGRNIENDRQAGELRQANILDDVQIFDVKPKARTTYPKAYTTTRLYKNVWRTLFDKNGNRR